MMISTNNKIVVWNCRGAASKAFYMYGKEYINMYKLTMSVVVETQKKIELLAFEDTIILENQGFSGRIIASWNKSYMTVWFCRNEPIYKSRINMA